MYYKYRVLGLLLGFFILGEASAPATTIARSRAEVEKIILRSRHLGAHGMGYNDRSLVELSRALAPDDIPGLISLLAGADAELRVGAQFALASQCEAAIQPVREAAARNEKLSSLDADSIMDLVADFSQCSPEIQSKARATRTEIDTANRDRQAKKAQELQEKAAEDARIQRNALKMNDPVQRKTLTRSEREEVFRRSIKAAGLENPQTPAQKALVDRMYHTMVLDEAASPKIQ